VLPSFKGDHIAFDGFFAPTALSEILFQPVGKVTEQIVAMGNVEDLSWW